MVCGGRGGGWAVAPVDTRCWGRWTQRDRHRKAEAFTWPQPLSCARLPLGPAGNHRPWGLAQWAESGAGWAGPASGGDPGLQDPMCSSAHCPAQAGLSTKPAAGEQHLLPGPEQPSPQHPVGTRRDVQKGQKGGLSSELPSAGGETGQEGGKQEKEGMKLFLGNAVVLQCPWRSHHAFCFFWRPWEATASRPHTHLAPTLLPHRHAHCAVDFYRTFCRVGPSFGLHSRRPGEGVIWGAEVGRAGERAAWQGG